MIRHSAPTVRCPGAFLLVPRSSFRIASATAALALASVVGLAGAAGAQDGYQPSPANFAARERFRGARFGLFIHWGIYSTLGAGEWVMNNRGITAADYERLAPLFNPVKFDAAAWVALAKASGVRYITITSKHHDGFAMFGSKVSDWNIVDRTPYARDPLKQLADECRKAGIALLFYHSQLDWHHPDYFPRGRTGLTAGRPDRGDWPRYLDYLDAQLSELLTNYGPIGGIWFDGMWDKPDADWRLARTYSLIHRLQPAALVGSNHHRVPFPGEDFQIFERDLPGENTFGDNTTTIAPLPLETAETINGAWGFNITDKDYKSPRQLVGLLVRAAGRDANLLLNVGPMPTGEIQSEFAERLRAMGAWLSVYGSSVYGTRGGPLAPRPWGVTTQRGDTVYVHVLDWPDSTLTLPALPGRVLAARGLKGGAPLAFRQDAFGVTLQLPPRLPDDYDAVVVLVLHRERPG